MRLRLLLAPAATLGLLVACSNSYGPIVGDGAGVCAFTANAMVQ